VLLLTIAIVTALWFQYVVGPSIVSQSGWIWKSYRAIPGSGKFIYRAWHDDCADVYEDQPDLLAQCAGNSGVFRPMFLAFFYFVVNAIVTSVIPHLNKEAWPAKYALFFFGLLIRYATSPIMIPSSYSNHDPSPKYFHPHPCPLHRVANLRYLACLSHPTRSFPDSFYGLPDWVLLSL